MKGFRRSLLSIVERLTDLISVNYYLYLEQGKSANER